MLKMAGVQLHPAVRILIGAVLIGVGLLRHTAPGVVIGAVLVVWGLAAVLGLTGGGRDADSEERRPR